MLWRVSSRCCFSSTSSSAAGAAADADADADASSLMCLRSRLTAAAVALTGVKGMMLSGGGGELLSSRLMMGEEARDSSLMTGDEARGGDGDGVSDEPDCWRTG